MMASAGKLLRGQKLTKHIYDYVITDSNVERAFVTELDASSEVAVYAKPPRGFFILTPVVSTPPTGSSPPPKAA